MEKTLRSVALGFMAVLATATVAGADMCLILSPFKGFFVGQNFSKPARGVTSVVGCQNQTIP